MSITMRRSRRRKLKNEINVVPYIDVMLVLLIIFMVTAPLLNLGVDIELPQSNAKSIESPSEPIVVTVDRDGNYFISLEAGNNDAVSPQGLSERVGAIVRQNPGAPVLINGDANASYQTVTDAIDLLKEAGVERVSLISKPRQDGP